MDFTREPVIETIITPREGCKLVVRSSKNAGQEEFLVDSLELISLGSAHFYRSLERPKSFVVPACDYEVVEVREARMILRRPLPDRSIRISSQKEKEILPKKEFPSPAEKKTILPAPTQFREDERRDKRRERRRSQKKRRTRDLPFDPSQQFEEDEILEDPIERVSSSLARILPPPEGLISDRLDEYRKKRLFSEVFGEIQPTKPSLGESNPPAKEEAIAPLSEEPQDKEQEDKASLYSKLSAELEEEKKLEPYTVLSSQDTKETAPPPSVGLTPELTEETKAAPYGLVSSKQEEEKISSESFFSSFEDQDVTNVGAVELEKKMPLTEGIHPKEQQEEYIEGSSEVKDKKDASEIMSESKKEEEGTSEHCSSNSNQKFEEWLSLILGEQNKKKSSNEDFYQQKREDLQE